MVLRPTLRFVAGTLEIEGLERGAEAELPGVRFDPRIGRFRAPAQAYANVVRALRRKGREVADEARAYEELSRGALVHREPRPYQVEALAAWKRSHHAGVVVLPTGAGKTHVAVMAIDDRRRSTLVVAPTLELVRQWHGLLRASFDEQVGIVGGGSHEVRRLTVATYDSAYLHMEHFGDRFGLVVFDECHHLPSETYALAARQSIAPFRLGLTATPERPDGRDSLYDELIGPIVYRRDIVELAGDYLAEYQTVRVTVELSETERREYEAERAIYRAFLVRHGVKTTEPGGWSRFVVLSARSAEGRRAMAAYRRQRELAFSAPAKLEYVGRLLFEHRHDRALIFTEDNATCYALSRRFLIPAITHQTRIKERIAILRGLSDGTYGAVVTSKVLNEGVDVPDANVAIVVSGSGSVREHVQRLGRILRKRDGKFALLYEIVTDRTTESFTSARRREHAAYR